MIIQTNNRTTNAICGLNTESDVFETIKSVLLIVLGGLCLLEMPIKKCLTKGLYGGIICELSDEREKITGRTTKNTEKLEKARKKFLTKRV